MPLMICDPRLIEPILADRRDREIDGHDEVWDGTYVVMPILDDEHQDIVSSLGALVFNFFGRRGRRDHCYMGINISDRDKDWLQNVRVPDFAIYLRGTQAKNRRTHWQGGPDLAVEIVTQGDRTREKLDFYAKVGTRELLIVDRFPWSLELYALKRKKLRLVSRTTLDNAKWVKSKVVPMTCRLVSGDARPLIEVRHTETEQAWRI